MRFLETKFEDYINNSESNNLHPKINKIINDEYPNINNIKEMKNTIIYGPSGVGKYTQSLCLIKKYSNSNLKYEKKIVCESEKKEYIIKISDIHYEIDMSLLGCKPKKVWNDLYNIITDSIIAKNNKQGIILCKNFHDIDNELLDVFYSYMEKINNRQIELKYILLTEQLSFIPINIIDYCNVININRPSKKQYRLCFNKNINKYNNNTNLKNIISDINIIPKHEKICNDLINMIIYMNTLNYVELRNKLYEILTYNLNIEECLWYILNNIGITNEGKSDVMLKIYPFLQYYNNNYRPIYHLEVIIFYLIKKHHEL